MINISQKEVPKCLVCNEIASGVHYGVLACEGCKGFFRRAITANACEGSSLVCYGSPKNQCNIAYRVRHVCQRCRLQKCFNVGMTRKHSKLGRKRKIHVEVIQSWTQCEDNSILNDNEFKDRIKQENKYFLREIGIFTNEDTSHHTKTSDIENSYKPKETPFHEPIESNKELHTDFKSQDFDKLPSFEIHIESDVLLSPTLKNFWSSPFPNQSSDSQINRPDSPVDNRDTKLFPTISPSVQINNSDIEQLFIEMNSFIHLQNRSDPDYMLFRKFRKLVPQAHMETCIVTIPIMENFFDNKYRHVIVDCDPESVCNILLFEMERITNRVVSFCHKLPDFKSVMPFSDAVNVIKLALFDIISIRYLRLVDLDRNQFFDPRLTRKIPAEVMAKNPLGPLFLRYLYVAEFIKRELVDPIDDYEMAYLSALCLTLPGWDSTQIKFINAGYLNKLKFFYCLCLYDHLLVRKYKGNIYETKRRMRKLYSLLDKIKIVTKTQADILFAINDKENLLEQSN